MNEELLFYPKKEILSALDGFTLNEKKAGVAFKDLIAKIEDALDRRIKPDKLDHDLRLLKQWKLIEIERRVTEWGFAKFVIQKKSD